MSEKQVTPELVQKLLADSKYRIELHSLVHSETEKVYKKVEALDPQLSDVVPAARKYIKEFEAISKTLRMIVAFGCYFGTKEQSYLWKRVLTRLATIPKASGNTFLLSLQIYPALLVLYAEGMSSLAAGNFENIKQILETDISGEYQDAKPLITVAHTWLIPSDAGNQIFELDRRKTPLSDHLYEILSKSLPPEVTFGFNIEDLFDEWEILIAMVVADIYRNRSELGSWAPVGRFSWRKEYSNTRPLSKLKNELDKEKPDWQPLRVGLLGGSPLRAKDALATVEKYADRISFF